MKTIKAVFKGQNGSCGYVTNMEYTLEVISMYDSGGNQISIQRSKLKDKQILGYCEYESIVSFLNNWDNIRNI